MFISIILCTHLFPSVHGQTIPCTFGPNSTLCTFGLRSTPCTVGPISTHVPLCLRRILGWSFYLGLQGWDQKSQEVPILLSCSQQTFRSRWRCGTSIPVFVRSITLRWKEQRQHAHGKIIMLCMKSPHFSNPLCACLSATCSPRHLSVCTSPCSSSYAIGIGLIWSIGPIKKQRVNMKSWSY